MTASNWEVNDSRLQVKPFVDDTATIPPRAGDSVLFPNSAAAYTVDIAGAPPLQLFYFNGASGATFVISGPLVANEFYTQTFGLVTFRGGGSIQAAKFYGVNDRVVFDGLTVVLHAPPVPGRAPSSSFLAKAAGTLSAPAASANTLLRNGAKLETIGPVALGTVRLEGASSWAYQSDTEQGLAITLTGGSTFTAAKTHSIVANGGLVAEGGSTFQISDMTGTRVRLSEGSRMVNQDAVAGSDVRIASQISFVDGTGTEWQVAGTFRPLGATGVHIRNGGAMNCGRIAFDDLGGGVLYVGGRGSTLNTVAPLEISNSGSVVATNGGLLTLPSANLNGGGASIEVRGANAEFRSAGAIIARKGVVRVSQGGQGRAQHLTLHNGSGSVVENSSLLTLAGNLEVGIEGQSSFDIGSGGKVVSDAGFVGGAIAGDGAVAISGANSVWELQAGGFIGDAGKGALTLSEGGKLVVKGDGAGLAVGFGRTGRGTVRLFSNGELDIRAGILAVGKEGEGIITVNAGTITAGQLLIGESHVTNRVTLTGTGSHLNVSRELIAGNGGNGVLQLRGGARADVRELKVGVEAPRSSAGVGVGTVSVENPNTVLSVTDQLSVGASEIGLLAVSAGARLEFLGTEARVGDEGVGVLAVTGDQSRLMAAKAALQVGAKGRGTFEISSGGQVYSQTGQIGMDGTGEVIVGHPEALWQIVSDLEIGTDDLGVLTIDDQARVESKSGFLGRKAGGNGNLFVLRNGLWTIENQLRIADQGNAAVILSQGGKVELKGGPLHLATSPHADGKLSVELPGSILTATNSAFEIARSGQAGVQILRGGALHTGEATAAVEPDSSANIAVVGPNSIWTVETGLRLGVAGAAELVVDGRGRVEVHGPLITGVHGVIKGEGSIAASQIVPAGILSPGSSPGTLRLEGPYQAQPTSTLLIEIGGTSPGTEHDVLRVARGRASLAGRLVLRFINGFAPRQGQLFDFLLADEGISGSFGSIEVTGLATGFQYDLRPGADGKVLALAALNQGVPVSTAEPLRLQIARYGPQILIECFSPTPSFILQGRTLDTPGSWSNLATNEHRFSFSPENGAWLFRLIQP